MFFVFFRFWIFRFLKVSRFSDGFAFLFGGGQFGRKKGFLPKVFLNDFWGIRIWFKFSLIAFQLFHFFKIPIGVE